MHEAKRIANLLTDGTDLVSAAILVALYSDQELEIGRDETEHLHQLEDAGCVHAGKCTALGARVAMVLRASRGIRPFPELSA